MSRPLRQTLTVLALTACLAAAQQSPAPAADARQSLSDAWWTGPMLAPNASTLPPGHILLEPYLFDVITSGSYTRSGARVTAPHENGYGNLTYFNYGLFNKFTVGLIPIFGYNEPSNGPGSSGPGVGDVTMQVQYRLHLFNEKSWIPTTSVNVQETLPTGKYDHLGTRPSDGFGAGAFTTTLGLYTQTFFWMPNGRILRMRFNVSPAFSRTVNLEDASVYGTTQGFRGHAKPGPSILVDAAWEYSLTRHWVLATDATYRNQANTSVSGYNASNPAQPILLNSGSSRAFGIAPAIEYNVSGKLGFLVGTRFFPSGRNTSLSVTPAIAINYVH